MLTKFEKRAWHTYLLADVRIMVLMPGSRCICERGGFCCEVEILESADGYYYWEREDGTIGISGYEGNEKGVGDSVNTGWPYRKLDYMGRIFWK